MQQFTPPPPQFCSVRSALVASETWMHAYMSLALWCMNARTALAEAIDKDTPYWGRHLRHREGRGGGIIQWITGVLYITMRALKVSSSPQSSIARCMLAAIAVPPIAYVWRTVWIKLKFISRSAAITPRDFASGYAPTLKTSVCLRPADSTRPRQMTLVDGRFATRCEEEKWAINSAE